MTTTLTYNYSPELAELMEEVFERCGIAPAAIGTEHIASFLRSMRLLLGSEWQTEGLRQFMMTQTTQATTAGMSSFTLPANSIDLIDIVVREHGRDTGLYRISRSDYIAIANKDQRGRPANFFVDRQADTRTVYFWPASSGITYSFLYNYFRKNQDPGSLGNTSSVSPHLLEALTAGLASKMALKYAADRLGVLKNEYREQLGKAKTEDRDRAPLQLTVRT
jgi:hypothetical protein